MDHAEDYDDWNSRLTMREKFAKLGVDVDQCKHTLSKAALKSHHFVPKFTLWTDERVYFPGHYDGWTFIASVPRHPCKEKTEHVGGG